VVSLHATPSGSFKSAEPLLSMGRSDNDTYIDRQASPMKSRSRGDSAPSFNWALLDVTRRSIEETAAAIIEAVHRQAAQRLAE